MPNFAQVFPRNDSVSLANIDRWVSAHLAGTLPPTLLSGPGADSSWLQASQWHEQIQRNSQNMKFTLVAFTARWCGFCKGLPPLIRVVDQAIASRPIQRDAFVTLVQILNQQALPVDVKLFDVDVNDAAVAAHFVNVTSVPTFILIPPLPSHFADSNASCTVCVFLHQHPSQEFFSNVGLCRYTGPLAVHDCVDFVKKEVMQLLARQQQP